MSESSPPNRIAFLRPPQPETTDPRFQAPDARLAPQEQPQWSDTPAAPERSEPAFELPTLPERKQGRSYGALISFLLFVALPVALATLYFGFYASSQYVAEFRFAVRDSRTSVSSSDSAGGISSLLGVSTSPNTPENYIVTDYMLSRQAVDDLLAKVDLRAMYSREGTDWWASFDPSLPVERLVTYWQRMVTASYDQVTGIATARVRAFNPEDALTIAKALLENSENVINKTANRPIWDAVKFAENDVRRAEERLKTIRGELTHFRNTEQIIEPNSSVVSTNTALAGSLKTTLLQLQTELATLSKRQLGPNAPAIVALQSRISATKDQLAMVESQVNTDKQGKPLSTVVGKFEQLDMERQFAQNMVLSTMQLLEQARANALAQHIYVNPFVHPSLPESSVFPRRILSIFVVGVICFMLWTIGLLVVRAIREHIA
jgi:capsular polysaccharide transport system permease protein